MKTLRPLPIAAACLLTVALAQAAAAAPFAYVADTQSNAVSVVDVATRRIVATIPVGRAPYGVAVNQTSTNAYVLNYLDNTVSVIDTAKRVVTATIAVGQPGGTPAGLALSSDGTRLYVANAVDNTLYVVDAVDNTVVGAPIAVGVHPVGVAISPSDAFVFVANSGGNSLSIVDAATLVQVAEIPVGVGPLGVAVHPAGSPVYVATGNGVAVVDVASMSTQAIVPVAGATAAAVAPDGQRLFVTSAAANALIVVDAQTNLPVGAPIAVGAQPVGVALTLDGAAAYVINSGIDAVSVVDAATLAIVDTIPVLSGPTALGTFIADRPPLPRASTTTRLASSVNPSAFGQPVAFTATVTSTGAAAEGTIGFFDGSSLIGTAAVAGGTASLTTDAPGAGSHAVTAVFTPAEDGWTASTSAVLTQSVNKAAGTAGSLTVSVLTPQTTDLETFKTSFTPGTPGGPAPSKVIFKVGTQAIGEAGPVLVGGVYQYGWTGQLLDPAGTSTRQMKPDFRAITAVFSDSNFTVTNPAPKSITIQKEDARVAYTGPRSVSFGGSASGTVTLRATVKDISAVAGDARWDAYPGDIRNAQVLFVDRSTGATIASVTPTLTGAGTAVGTATFDWPVNLGTSKSKTFTIGIVVSYYYNRNSTSDDATVVVSKP